MLFGVVLGLSGFFKTRESGKAVIDDIPFRLFYGFTGGVLFLCSALVGLQELVGNNINCHANVGANHQAVDQYCWVTGTHLVVNSDHGYGLSKNVYSGEERCVRENGSWFTQDGEECIKTHSYYQWVPYVLLAQGCLFFLPNMLWKKFEEGKLSSVSDGMRSGCVAGITEHDKIRNFAQNVVQYINMKNAGHTLYGWAYLGAQTLNGVILAGVVYWNNRFLDNDFHSLGLRWLKAVFNPDASSGMVLYKTFPRLTRCLFQSFGTGGHLQEQDFLCVLAPNIISEKIFVFLWFWYSILGVIFGLNLILIILMVLKSAQVRSMFIMRAVSSRKVRRHIGSHENLKRKLEAMEFGKFLFLYFLGRNVEYFAYKRILDLVVEGEDDGSPQIHAEAQKGSQLQRQLSKPNVKDASNNELYGPLPHAPHMDTTHTPIDESFETATTLPRYDEDNLD